MNKNKVSIQPSHQAIALVSFVSSIALAISLVLNASPVLAHHPNGGKIPSTLMAGFLSGLGHPVIGIDHLVFVIAIGLLAALSSRLGMVIPIAFIVATAIGTGVHLQSIDLPLVELIISASVLGMGIFLTRKKQANLALLTAVSAIAGIFHGYAYGESIVGAETTALGAYLLGFCAIQLGISIVAYYLGKQMLHRTTLPTNLPLRFAGFTICGIGLGFLSNTILG
ncbi:HupE/UreJ family protein [Waterburya agarophytonicola K14]|uniref:HupE/UreJ family protein n=1 Tax=Waterburya agarophytonicola KI4 TaxID=2874699 RepID=A0A964FGA6_9CYAN|nr:HupE/UreJ family protein [Waterburya agarophytonicola]MCC0176414.1 HupE/UreJ family protein [Waterburya agarophytonicola KI4]